MNKLKQRIRRFVLAVGLMMMKRKADRLARKTRDQYFIVNVNGNAQIMSKKQFKYMRQRGAFPLSFTATQLKQIALYYTKKA
ncbi:hypothetical protein [Tannerella forsythia]|uniref:hypothetical protein n=1 Tax=Tannerella forsythia TaxID=28112 RepID=UPI000764A972|nr:hypothetical protein [Tannerella forsythia]